MPPDKLAFATDAGYDYIQVFWAIDQRHPTIIRKDTLLEDVANRQKVQLVITQSKTEGGTKKSLTGASRKSSARRNVANGREPAKAPALLPIHSEKRPSKASTFTSIPNMYQNKHYFCTAHSVMNLLDVDNHSQLAQNMLAMGEYADVKRIADVCMRSSVSLNRVTNVDDRMLYLLAPETTGKFVVQAGAHCVGVDCDRRLIRDNGYRLAKHLTEDNFKLCGEGFASNKTLIDVRRVIDNREGKLARKRQAEAELQRQAEESAAGPPKRKRVPLKRFEIK